MPEIKRKNKKNKSWGMLIKDSFMAGISYMIPVVVAGGVLQAIGKAMGGYDIGTNKAMANTLAHTLFYIGQCISFFVVPVIAAFTAYAMADKPAIAPGLAMGYMAVDLKTGFLGGLIGGLIVGFLVLQIKKVKVHKNLQGLMPILIIPVCVSLAAGLLMYYVIGTPIAAFIKVLTNFLTSLSGGSRFIFGAVIGAMCCFDMGGPVNKTAATLVNGLNADGFFIPTSAKMCAGMTPPLAMTIATFLGGKKKFTAADRENAKANIALSCCYITEGAIPFAVNDPLRVVPCICIGGAITGGLCMVSAIESPAIHGGMFVIPMMSKPLLFIAYWFLGALIGGVLYAIIKKPLPADFEDDEEATSVFM